MNLTAVNMISRLSVVAIVLLAPYATHAEAGDWYATGSIVYNDDDPDRKLDDGVSGVQFNLGRDFSRNLAFEGLLSYSNIDGYYLVTPPSTYVRDSETQLNLGANVLAFYNRDARFAPYALAGIGYHNADLNIGGSDSNPMASLGAGFKYRLGDSPFSLRTEFRLRKAFDSGDRDYTDFIGMLGLQYSFGGGTEEPEVIPLVNDAPVPPADTDNDGVPDSIDLCPGTAPGANVDASGCVPDSDGDGVADDRDKCPGTLAGADVDSAGCEKMHFENARFDTESAVLDSSARRALDDIAALLARHPDAQVEVAGHADSRGPEDYNMRLSVSRAEAVRNYLAQKGIAASRMTVRGYGESQPTASNDSAQGQAENRRVELRVTNR